MRAKLPHTIFTLLIVPIVAIALLVKYGPEEKRRGGFTREFLYYDLKSNRNISLGANGYHIAGFAASKIYLSNPTQVHDMILVTKDLSDTQHVYIDTHDLGIAHVGVRTIIDSPFIYQNETMNSILLTGYLSNMRFSKTQLPNLKFFEVVPLDTQSFIILKYDTLFRQSVFVRANHETIFSENIFIPRTEGEGLFSIDGVLHKHKNDKSLIYVFYYKNEFVRLDSNLKLIYSAKTIDTNRFAKVKVAKVRSRQTLNLAGPSPYVNRMSSVNKNYLFIYSAAMADNERDKNGFPIDVYLVENGSYQGSFYLPALEEMNLNDFKVLGNKLFAVFGDRLLEFPLTLPNFPSP